jgi:metal-responsive CopG/Arc/MetJ family transcriptional regulator
MQNNLLEDVPLVPKYIMLNPSDLEEFDALVGARNRSKVIRELIRGYNKNAMVQTSKHGAR